MNDLKQRWIDALRSGEYKQGRGALIKQYEDGYRYCCLGVLCDIVGLDRQDTEFIDNENYTYIIFPPSDIRDKLGLNEMHEEEYSKEVFLSRLNDRGVPFDEIADWIEENV